MDKQFVLSVLKKELALAEKEEANKAFQKKKVLEFNEKLKMDMNSISLTYPGKEKPSPMLSSSKCRTPSRKSSGRRGF